MAEIIQSYGLFWKAENVYWQAGGRTGQLLGVPARARSSEPINFQTQIGIYVLYSGHDMVYVGQAGGQEKARLYGRLKRHRRDMLAGRWDAFSWFGLRRVLASGKLSTRNKRATPSVPMALNHIEAVLIASAEPHLNRQGGRFGKDVVRCLQVRDPRLGLTDEQMIQEMWRRMESWE